MKIPKTFVPEKSLEIKLYNILSQKFYTIDKTGSKILVQDFNGGLMDSNVIGERLGSLETFNFSNHKMFTVKFSDDLDQRVFFDERLNPIIMTPGTKNQAYCVFERKNDTDLLMVNFTVNENRYTKITFFNHDGTKFDDTYLNINDILTNNTFVVKTKEQNYLAFCFGYQTILLHEDLKAISTLHTVHNINDIHTVNLNGDERIIALGFNKRLSYQILKIFDNKLNVLKELNTKDFKNVLPIDDPWHDQLLSFKPYRIGSKDYFFAAVERKNKKDRIDLKVLNTNFEEVFQLEDIVKGYYCVERFNGKDQFFVMINKGPGLVHIYDEDFNVKDEILTYESSLQGRYKVMEFNEASYFACVNEGYLTLYSGKIPFYGSHWTKKKVASADIKLKNINSGLKKIIPFDYKGKDYLALEYENNDGVDVYDENFKFVRNFPGGDFCIA